jgi:hypothetical protein
MVWYGLVWSGLVCYQSHVYVTQVTCTNQSLPRAMTAQGVKMTRERWMGRREVDFAV